MPDKLWKRFVAWRQLLHTRAELVQSLDPLAPNAASILWQTVQINAQIVTARERMVAAILKAEKLIPRHYFHVAVTGAIRPRSLVVLPDYVVVGRHFFDHPYTRLEDETSEEPLHIDWARHGPAIETVRIDDLDRTLHYYGPDLIAEVELSTAVYS